MVQKQKSKASGAVKAGIVKVDKFTKDNVDRKPKLKKIKLKSRREVSTSDVYDRDLLALAERQMKKSKRVINRQASKPIVVAPATLILPTKAAQQSFQAIDQLLESDQQRPEAKAVHKTKKPVSIASANMFGGLSDSEDEGDEQPAMAVQPAAFVWKA